MNQELKNALEKALLNLKTQKAIADKAELSEPTIMRLLSKPIGEMIEVKTHKALMRLSEFKNTTSGMVTPVNQNHYEKEPTDCEHICEKLNDWEKDTLTRHISLELSARKSVWKKWDTDISEAEKKSADCAPGSGHCEDTESIPNDLHREKIS